MYFNYVTDDIFKCIFLNEKVQIFIQISLKCISKSPIINKSAFVQIMAGLWSGDKPLSEQMMYHLTDEYIFVCVSLGLN